MKTKNILILLLLMFPILSLSQEKTDSLQYWKIDGIASVTGAQVYLEDWAAGGDNSLSINSLLNINANYKKDNISWTNNLNAAYGFQQIQDENNLLKKTDDKLEFASKFGYRAVNNLYYSTMLEFKTQLDKGYEYLQDGTKKIISLFMAPAYMLYTIGIDYKPGDAFALYLSPLTGKTTFVLNEDLANAGAFGVEPGQKVRSELGAYMKVQLNKEIMKNVSLQTKLNLFTNYKDKLQEIDVNWDMLIAMKINEYLTANISTNLIYDEDVEIAGTHSKVQFKEVVGFGVAWKFSNHAEK